MEFGQIGARRIGAIFACFCVAWVCQRQLGFFVILSCSEGLRTRSPLDRFSRLIRHMTVVLRKVVPFGG